MIFKNDAITTQTPDSLHGTGRNVIFERGENAYLRVNLLLGVTAAVLGVLCLCIPGLGGPALSVCLGLGLILASMVYFIALTAVNRFEKRLRKNPWIDKQQSPPLTHLLWEIS